MSELVLKGGQILLTEDQSVYRVVSGTALVYAALRHGEETGRRYFLAQMEQGERIPSMQFDDENGHWVIVISAMGEVVLEAASQDLEEVQREFSRRLDLMETGGGFGEDVVEHVNLRLVTEEGYLYSVSEEQKKTRRKSLSLIFNLFRKKSRQLTADLFPDPVYNAAAFLCRERRISIASFEQMREACGRKFSIEDIARVSHFSYRKVRLEDKWYRKDSGPLLVFMEDGGEPMVAVPKGNSRYVLRNVETGSTEPVNEALAEKLSADAYMFYRPFPAKKLGLKDLVWFGLQAVKPGDIVNLLVMALLSALIGMLLPYMNQLIFDEYIPLGDQTTLLQVGALILSFTIANLLFAVIKNLSVFRSANACEYEVQAAMFDRVYNLPGSFFNQYDSGDLGDRVMGVATMYNIMSNTVINAVLMAVFSVVYLYRMFHYSPALSWMGLFLLLINIGFVVLMGFLQIRHERDLIEVKAKIQALMYQILGGISKIKIAGVEDRALVQYLEPYSQSRKTVIKKSRLDNLSLTLNAAMGTLFTIIFYYLMVWKDQKVSFGEFMAFTAAFQYFSNAMVSVATAFLTANQMIPIFRRAKPILETLPEFEEDVKLPGKLEGRIELNNVSFRYDEDGPDIISNISLSIKKGEYVGIVGSSGSGKSTLLKLLLGFEKPTQGKIYYDDQDIDSLDKRELRKQFGVVLQDGQLLSGSIFENIAITGQRITEEKVMEIVKMVGLEEDIAQMPMGLNTVVAEGSGTISGGQRQRILIGRAIANNPKILYFDEATSALDNVNQALVCESLEKLNVTRVVIAHRLSTVVDCDRILVLENGRLVEQGKYDELMKLGGRFYELASRQIV